MRLKLIAILKNKLSRVKFLLEVPNTGAKMSVNRDPNHPVMVSQKDYKEIEKVLQSTPEYGKPRSGLYYVIPAIIMDSKKLEPMAKLLYALISGLADEQGMCYPSDMYLSERLGISERQVQNLLQQIEELSLIRRETHRSKLNMFIKKRKIFVLFDFKKCLPDEHPCRTGDVQLCDIHTNTRSDIESEVKNIESEAPPLPPPRKEKEEAPSTEEEEEICRRLKNRPLAAPPITVMREWRKEVLRDIRKDRANSDDGQHNFEKHKKIAYSMDMKKFGDWMVFACPGHVEFTSGSQIKIVTYESPDRLWVLETEKYWGVIK